MLDIRKEEGGGLVKIGNLVRKTLFTMNQESQMREGGGVGSYPLDWCVYARGGLSTGADILVRDDQF